VKALLHVCMGRRNYVFTAPFLVTIRGRTDPLSDIYTGKTAKLAAAPMASFAYRLADQLEGILQATGYKEVGVPKMLHAC
jgi:hypothetical protein